MSLRGNLSDQAFRDLSGILDQSLQYGVLKARETARKLEGHLARIASGISLGHRRLDIPTTQPTLFIVERPFVIAYNPHTRQVLRIVDGRRDLVELFSTESPS